MSGRDWRYLKPWIKQLRSMRLQCIVGLLLAVATALFGIGLLSLSGWFITAAALYTAFDIYTPGGGIRFFAVARTVSRYIERLVNHDVVLKLQARWRIALFKRLQGLPLSCLTKLRVADGVQHLTRNLDAMDNLLLRLIAPAVVFVLSSVALLMLWSLFVPQAAAVLFVAVLLVAWVSATMAVRTRRLALQQLQSTQRLRRQSMATAESITELLAWDAYEPHQQQLLIQASRQERLDDQQLAVQYRALGWVDVLSQAVFLSAVWFGGLAFEANTLSSAELIMLVLSALAWQELAGELPMQWGGYGKTLAAARALLTDRRTSQGLSSTATEALTAHPLTLRNVSVARGGRALIKPVSAAFTRGKVHWLQGPSGLGKSSLAEAITGWLPLASGSVAVNHDTDDTLGIGFLTQRTEILDDTIRENLNPAKRKLNDERLWAVLASVELDDVIERLPERLDTVVGSRGVMLSGGQLRRLALARVLLQDRPVLLLDEPFAGLERSLSAQILGRIVRAGPEKTWIIISHIGPEQLSEPRLPVGEVIALQPA